ncbi:MAG: PAC2 family protein [Nanoarchaeota archaeon]|nr:PAC2 family protein [Nanoarchaeota archaeon]
MEKWKITKESKFPKISSATLIVGLPGIGNVGKIVTDFMVEELKAKKVYSFFSYKMPHSVYVNEKNLIELPSIEMYHKRTNEKQDFLILTGDVQPIDETSCYEFCDGVLDLMEQNSPYDILTLGGIGLREVPKHPKVYCTATSKKYAERLKKYKSVNPNVYGVVGPIIGVSGLMLGLAKKRHVEGAALLAETYGHPLFIGIKGAREILDVINKHYKLNMNLKSLDDEIKSIEDVHDPEKQIKDLSKKSKFLKKVSKHKETSYIG